MSRADDNPTDLADDLEGVFTAAEPALTEEECDAIGRAIRFLRRLEPHESMLEFSEDDIAVVETEDGHRFEVQPGNPVWVEAEEGSA